MSDELTAQVADEERVDSDADSPVILDRGRRLSESILWEMQNEYFKGQGIEAWRKGTVPHYITSNAFIAAAYAKVVMGYIRDLCGITGNIWHNLLDLNQPIYIVELGCGHGRFAYHFLKKFGELQRSSIFQDIPFKYLMTDYSERSVGFWKSHELLQPSVDEGILDFAKFDPLQETELKLACSGESLSSGTVRNPMIFIANYFFDGVLMDLFRIRDGKLHESLVTVSSPQEELDPTDPEILSRMKLSYEHVPAHLKYYESQEWNSILESYLEGLDNTWLLFPSGALQCIENLNHISHSQMLLLSADRGTCREADLCCRGEPSIAVHGSFSFGVNYDAIGKYFVNRNGVALQPGHSPASLIVSAFISGGQSSDYPETHQAYRDSVEEFGPDDFFTLKKGIEKQCDDLNVDQLLAVMRLGSWDENIFMICFRPLMRQVEDASGCQKEAVRSMVKRVWEGHFPLGETTDLAFHLGTLLCQLEFFSEALRFLVKSTDSYGQSPGTSYNMAICHKGLGELNDALALAREALRQDPEFEAARTLHNEIAEYLNR